MVSLTQRTYITPTSWPVSALCDTSPPLLAPEEGNYWNVPNITISIEIRDASSAARRDIMQEEPE